MKNSILIKTVLITVALPLFAGCIVERQPRRVVYVQQPAPQAEVVVEDPAPPPPQNEVITVAPDPTFIWIGGNWEWRGHWVWAGGHWDRPHPGRVWVHGGWEHRGNSRVWVAAHWR
jgi:hypothetical protein